jgi:hypothetical protein
LELASERIDDPVHAHRMAIPALALRRYPPQSTT